ncbi:hypothetical protein [Nitrosopumilus ureiphilus]|uniref:hypothetical protein n=1 Tax=Nitrosopumilus ureiphilus TaxID=1470067 RepID=UPI0015CC1FFD|nr:hypothetical protein [Nitrosopumilus ureiphilus]
MAISSSVVLSYDIAYGLYMPQYPDELLESSDIIIVGTVIETKVRNETMHYTFSNSTHLDVKQEYTMERTVHKVLVEEYLKNTLNWNDTLVDAYEPVIGTPGGSSTMGKTFENDDRVLLYFYKDTNEYLPESFKVPQECSAKDALTEKRLWFVDYNYEIMQNDLKFNGTDPYPVRYVAINDPIHFVYRYDADSMTGKSIDATLKIRWSSSDQLESETILQQDITLDSKMCEFIAHEEWEFNPTKEGDYRITISIKDDLNSQPIFSTSLDAKLDVDAAYSIPPLKQYHVGIKGHEAWCKEGLFLILKNDDTSNIVYDNHPACVTKNTLEKLIERNWGFVR